MINPIVDDAAQPTEGVNHPHLRTANRWLNLQSNGLMGSKRCSRTPLQSAQCHHDETVLSPETVRQVHSLLICPTAFLMPAHADPVISAAN